MRSLFVFLTAVLMIQGTVGARNILPLPAHQKELAIVIDDLGNDMKGTEEILHLPVTLTLAIMPFLPSTKADAENARRFGHEVIVHLPMEPVSGKASWLGPGAILTSLSNEEIRSRVEKAIGDVPYAVGVNHHMGSKATADERVMRIVLEVCKEGGSSIWTVKRLERASFRSLPVNWKCLILRISCSSMMSIHFSISGSRRNTYLMNWMKVRARLRSAMSG